MEDHGMTNTEKACRSIRAAKNETQVMAAVREYLDSLDAKDLATLPAELLVLGLTPAEELIQAALQALHDALPGSGAKGGAIVNDTALVFKAAARRLAALAEDAV